MQLENLLSGSLSCFLLGASSSRNLGPNLKLRILHALTFITIAHAWSISGVPYQPKFLDSSRINYELLEILTTARTNGNFPRRVHTLAAK